MRQPRPAARILLTNAQGQLLLFRFTADDRPPFWCTPGGALDAHESYSDAARRELIEETGLTLDPGPEIARRTADFLSLEGVEVTADERYFRVHTDVADIDTGGHTELERRVMRAWRWFARDELAGWPETIYPHDILDLLDATDDQ